MNELATDPEVTGESPALPEAETPEEEAPPEEPAEEAADEEEEKAAEEEPVDETPDPTVEMKKEIEGLRKEQIKLGRRQMYLQRKLEKKSQVATALPEIEQSDAQAPKPDDYDTVEAYEAAMIDYKVDQKVNQKIQDYRKKAISQEIDADKAEFIGTVHEEGSGKYKDWSDVMNDESLPITADMVDVLRELDNPADIAYYLGKNRKETAAISRMSRVQAVRALTEVEAKVAHALENPPKEEKPAKKVTKAPPPITPSKGGSAAVSKDPNKMSQAEFEEWYNKEYPEQAQW